MSHLDEGQLHALLDGELTGSERSQAEAHLAGCAECRAAYDEARAFFQEADALIAAVDLPPASTPSIAPAKTRGRGGFRWKQLAWAATVVLALGLGWVAKSRQTRVGDARFDVVAAPASAPAPAAGAAPAMEKPAPPPAEAEDRLSRTQRAKTAPAPSPSAKSLEQPAPKEEVDAPAQPAAPAAEPSRANEVGQLAEAAVDTGAERKLADVAPVAQERSDLEPRDARRSAPLPNATTITRDESLRGYAAARGAPAPSPLRTVPMEEAVRILGGSIRLVDGMTPTRILAREAGPAGGVPSSLVRVVYEDPPKRELWLDQERPVELGADAAVSAQGVTALLPGDTVVVVLNHGARSLRWLDQAGFRLGLTGFLPTDSLWALARRVQ